MNPEKIDKLFQDINKSTPNMPKYPIINRLYLFRTKEPFIVIYFLDEFTYLRGAIAIKGSLNHICAITINENKNCTYYDKYLCVITEEEFYKLLNIWKINQIVG